VIVHPIHAMHAAQHGMALSRINLTNTLSTESSPGVAYSTTISCEGLHVILFVTLQSKVQ